MPLSRSPPVWSERRQTPLFRAFIRVFLALFLSVPVRLDTRMIKSQILHRARAYKPVLSAARQLSLRHPQLLPSSLSLLPRRSTMSISKTLPECWGHRGVSTDPSSSLHTPKLTDDFHRPRLHTPRTRSPVSRPQCVTARRASRAVFCTPV